MPVPNRNRVARLQVESLETRLTPAADLSRVLVTTAGPSLDAQWAAVIGQSPAVVGVEKVSERLFRADLADGSTAAEVLADLLGRDGVATAQPDTLLTPDAAVTPNDPGYGPAWQYAATNAAAAWGVTTGTGRTVVAVIDTGVAVTHPDLAANIWRNPREVAGNGRDDDGNGYVDDTSGWNFAGNNNDVSDAAGHGTHAAGIVGAVGNNGVGGTGVNWRVRIMPLKFMNSSAGGFTSDAVRAIDYAVANGANVINASWGGGGYDAALAAAIGRARASGVIVVTAAGNQSANTDSTPFYPAGYALQSDNVVSVAALAPGDQLAAFSNYGSSSVALAAPGQWITSTMPGGGYAEKSGTSMAAPFVAGAISLLWDANPTWSYRQVIDRLKATVTPVPALAGKVATGGRVDVGKMLAPSPAPAAPAAPSTPTTSVSVAESVVGGPRAGAIDRAWVRFTAPVDAATVLRSVDFGTPLGTFHPSAALPVAGTNNTQYTVVFGRTFTTTGLYHLSIGSAAIPRFTQDTWLGMSAPVSPPPVTVPPPVSPPATPTPTAGRQSVSAAGMPRAVSPGRTTRVELYVPDAVTVRDVAVQLSVQHGRVSDLSIRLTAPNGQRFTLFNRRGGAGANLSGTVFTDSAGPSLSSAAAPFAGAVRPEQSLAALNGTSGRGLWVVEIFNLGTDRTGTLTGVTLSFSTASTQSIAWSATSLPKDVTPVVTALTPAAKPTGAFDAGRPDAVTKPTPPKPLPLPPADVTGWLVARIRERLGD